MVLETVLQKRTKTSDKHSHAASIKILRRGIYVFDNVSPYREWESKNVKSSLSPEDETRLTSHSVHRGIPHVEPGYFLARNALWHGN